VMNLVDIRVIEEEDLPLSPAAAFTVHSQLVLVGLRDQEAQV